MDFTDALETRFRQLLVFDNYLLIYSFIKIVASLTTKGITALGAVSIQQLGAENLANLSNS